ncbi:CDGSH iron-sulfur domain-containing protein [Paeniglutamicibacter sp. ORCA_105]|jgi:CDGSH-type Zn-finger protein|uniref:CDGSH iron-sulfur domain-containing protein n=1 Tax=Paeniglutamicibacter sp. ORCA_105 TaxID=3377336 RepID=UPI0038964999
MSNSGPASITVCPRGPLIVRGSFDIVDGDNQPVDPRRGTVALCRCGGSKIKPFCDGSHKLLRFDEPQLQNANEDDNPPLNFSHTNTKEKNTMNESQEPTTDAAEKKEQAKREDHVSDPALSTETGHDWTDEGGAIKSGPATSNDNSE